MFKVFGFGRTPFKHKGFGLTPHQNQKGFGFNPLLRTSLLSAIQFPSLLKQSVLVETLLSNHKGVGLNLPLTKKEEWRRGGRREGRREGKREGRGREEWVRVWVREGGGGRGRGGSGREELEGEGRETEGRGSGSLGGEAEVGTG